MRSTPDNGHARSPERLALHRVERLRLANVAQMLSTDLDGAALFLRMARAGLFEPINTVPVMNLREIEGRQALAERGGDRQPERQNHLWTPRKTQAVIEGFGHVVGCCHLSGL